jgi:hypothetical protein
MQRSRARSHLFVGGNVKKRKPARTIPAALLLAVLPASISYAAETHVVPLGQIHERAIASTQQRERNIAELDRLFSSKTVEKAFRAKKLDGTQLRQAIPLLSDTELSELAEKAKMVQSNFAAGSLSNQDLTYIVIALATAVLVLVIVEAH